MTPEERDLITSLFDRLRSAEGSLQKDREAEQLIARQVSAQPAAPYQLSQTVLVQEHALHNAQQRIADLERQLAGAGHGEENRAPQSGGSFLSGLLGGNRERSTPQPPPIPTSSGGSGAVPVQASAPPPAMAYPSTTNMAPGAGGGFLRSALATAAGVAGGSLLFQGIGNLLGHNAGPFSSFMGSGGGGMAGFAGGGMPMGGNTEVVNNYYGDNPGGGGGGGMIEGLSQHGGSGMSVGDFAGQNSGGSGMSVGDFADQSSGGGDASGFSPTDFDPGTTPTDDGFQNLVDDNGGGGGGFFDDGGGSSDDGTLV